MAEDMSDEIREKNIKDIKNGSYKGIFYGVEGSKGRRFYQPLLNYFLAKEQDEFDKLMAGLPAEYKKDKILPNLKKKR